MGLNSFNFFKGKEPEWLKETIAAVKKERPDVDISFKKLQDDGGATVKINGGGDYGLRAEDDLESRKKALLWFIEGVK